MRSLSVTIADMPTDWALVRVSTHPTHTQSMCSVVMATVSSATLSECLITKWLTHTKQVECTQWPRCRVTSSTGHRQLTTQNVTANRQPVLNSWWHYVVTDHLIRQCAVAVTNQHTRIITFSTNRAQLNRCHQSRTSWLVSLTWPNFWTGQIKSGHQHSGLGSWEHSSPVSRDFENRCQSLRLEAKDLVQDQDQIQWQGSG